MKRGAVVSNAPRSSNANRNWGAEDEGASIMHVDMDAFYASVEVAKKPILKGKPVIVGGGERSVVLASTYEARALGIRSAMPMARARLLAPQAIFVPPDFKAYQEVSRGVMSLLKSVTPEVEQISVDEAFLDVSGSRLRLGGPVEIGKQLRSEIEGRWGVTCSVGIAKNKFVAKLASTNCKPDGLMLVPAAQTVNFVHCLPVGALWGVGAKTQERLEGWGVTEVKQLAEMSVEGLARIVGQKTAAHLHALAWGRDSRGIETSRTEKSIGAETTFERDLSDSSQIYEAFWALADEVGSRLRKRGMVGRTIAIKVRNANFETITRSHSLKSPTNSSKALFECARELFDSVKRQSATRLVGVRVENLEPESATSFQDTLFESESGSSLARDESERVMDQIRAKFGMTSIERAAQRGVRLSRLD